MTKTASKIPVWAFVLLFLFSATASADDPGSPGADSVQCAEDEIDTGEYCVKVVPAEPEPPGTPKKTPFRKESMMPGVVRRKEGQEATPKPAIAPATKPAVVVTQTIPAAIVAEGGFGIQLGAWSRRDSAAGVCNDVAPGVSGVILSPIPRGESILWACLAGPYASEDASSEDLANLKADSRFAQAWVKPLKGMKVEAVDDD